MRRDGRQRHGRLGARAGGITGMGRRQASDTNLAGGDYRGAGGRAGPKSLMDKFSDVSKVIQLYRFLFVQLLNALRVYSMLYCACCI